MAATARRPMTAALAALVLAGTAIIATSVSHVTAAGAAGTVETYPIPSTGSIAIDMRGNGHGHGLSQYGARGAAIAGLTAAQIIAFYYPGTTLKTLSSATKINVKISSAGTTLTVAAAPGMHVTGVTGALGTTGVAKYRLVSTATGLSLEILMSAAGSNWRPTARRPADGATFSSDFNVLRMYRVDHTTTTYHGALTAWRTSGGVYTVNLVGLDDYTAGVVPREMPASWQPAAVQAQAIAARSYGRNAGENGAPGRTYDLCDTTQCQVYGGMTHYDTAGNVVWSEDRAALSGNAFIVTQYQGRTAFTQFSASNGGWTTAGGLPYLVAKQDNYDNVASQDPYLDWTQTVDVSDLAGAYGLTSVSQVQITGRDGHGAWGGRATSVAVTGMAGTTKKTVTDTGNGFQGALGLPTDWYKPDVPGANLVPKGVRDSTTMTAPGTIAVLGWAFDPNHIDLPGKYYVTIDGVQKPTQTTAVSRTDVQRVYGLLTAMVGYNQTYQQVAVGAHTVCVVAVDLDGGPNGNPACGQVTVTS